MQFETETELNKIINKKNNFIKKITNDKNKKKFRYNLDDFDELFNFIEGGYCKYSDLIQTNIAFNNEQKFGRFFKNNGGIKPHVNNIYEFLIHKQKYLNSQTMRIYKSIIIFNFMHNNNLYYSTIIVDIDNGSCETCNMNYNKDCKMYINNNLRDLIYYSIGNELDSYLI